MNCRLRYPKRCLDKAISGRAVAQFDINEDGKLVAKVLNKVDPDIEAEVLRVLLDSKGWKPGYCNNKHIMTRMILAFNFSME